ncbi:hypothetical protein F5Y14DRAFT_451890 [Nemania sp. NC0429]|nr:hypothetical protein F5Y14DRAFT_451890 [Nemania sp. NC0429]
MPNASLGLTKRAQPITILHARADPHGGRRVDALDRHVNGHTGRRQYPCLQCDDYRGPKAFYRRDHLRQHMRHVHRDIESPADPQPQQQAPASAPEPQLSELGPSQYLDSYSPKGPCPVPEYGIAFQCVTQDTTASFPMNEQLGYAQAAQQTFQQTFHQNADFQTGHTGAYCEANFEMSEGTLQGFPVEEHHEFTITRQSDIDEGPLQSCLVDQFPSVVIRNATGTLKFPRLTEVNGIHVGDSPQLEILEFPDLRSFEALNISHAAGLTNISMPAWVIDCAQSQAHASLSITDAPSLAEFTVHDPNCLKDIQISNVAVNSSGLPDINFSLGNVSHIAGIITDTCMDIGSLNVAYSLSLSGCESWDLGNLTSAGSLSLSGSQAGGYLMEDLPEGYYDGSVDFPALRIELDMHVGSWVSGRSNYDDSNNNEISLRQVGTVAGDLNITSNTAVHIAYDGLTEVGGILDIRHNTNCTFNFERVSNVSTLIFADNPYYSELPYFVSLDRAESIHVSGFIHSSIGSNIFPALKYVQNVTVQALTDEFDCSAIVSQREERVIRNLKCNGRNNETGIITSTPTQGLNAKTGGGSKLSGAWAGIGAGSSIVAIGILATLWLFLHFRKRPRATEKTEGKASSKIDSLDEAEPLRLFSMQEVDGRGPIREKPDDHTEMATQPAELPTRSQSRAELEPDGIGRAL